VAHDSNQSSTLGCKPNGNTRTKTDSTGTTTYNWDFENRLASVQLPNSTTVTFKYDPFGTRIQKNGTSTTNYTYDGASVIEEVDQSENLLAKYSQGAGIDEPLSELRSGAINYYEQDGLGSVTSLSNLGGALANTEVYDSFGNLTSSSGALTNPYQYTGRDYDPETGLRYYRARYYDPATGRFLSEDPLKFQTGVNHYVYVANDPINLYDPSGKRTRVCCRKLKGPEIEDLWSFLRKMGAKGSGQKHCFILVTGDEVPDKMPNGNLTYGRITIALNRNEKTGEGEVHDWNFGSDKVPNEARDCTDVNDATPCKEGFLIRLYKDQEINPCAGCGHNYHWLGPNSNTFVYETLENFGMTPPPIKSAPGYKHF